MFLLCLFFAHGEYNTTQNLSLKSLNDEFESNTNEKFDYEDDYTDEDGDEDNEEGVGRTNGSGRGSKHRQAVYIVKRVGITYAWGKWEKWSRCKNSCVQIRKRHCIKRCKYD